MPAGVGIPTCYLLMVLTEVCHVIPGTNMVDWAVMNHFESLSLSPQS